MKKEFIIFLLLFIVLALSIHPDFFTNPLMRISELPKSGAYGFGAMHPFVFALLAYIVLWIFRGIFRGIMKLFRE